jgi:hypothetical protein
MLDASRFIGLHLLGGFVVEDLAFTQEPIVDALGREAAAQTRIVGRRFHLLLRRGMSSQEESVSLYHEVLEAAAVASPFPPESVVEFNEGDFERAAQAACDRFGPASPENLNRMLRQYGIEVDLIKLADGDRLLRLTERGTGLALEKKLDAQQPVVRQKLQLLGIFKAALAQAQEVAA